MRARYIPVYAGAAAVWQGWAKTPCGLAHGPVFTPVRPPDSCFGICCVIGVSFMGISKDKPSGRYDISRTSAHQSLDIENLPRLPSWIWRIAGKPHNRPYTRSILLSGYRVSGHFYDSLHFLPLIQTKRHNTNLRPFHSFYESASCFICLSMPV